MQYELTLPADYDMRAFRARAAAAFPILDDRAGLAWKAYVIRDRGVDGSPVNQYAPFFVWHDAGAMAEFLVGGAGLERIIRLLGRPAVHHWTGLATVAGPARAVAPRAASRRIITLPADPDPDDTGLGLAERVEREIAAVRALGRREGVHTATLALDPRHWQLVRFVLWQDAVPADEHATERYENLYLCAPDLAALPEGRAW